MKMVRLIIITFIAASFLINCNKNNRYYAPRLYEGFSIQLPLSWDSIQDWPTDEEVITNKFIGERDVLTGLELHVYDINNNDSISIDTLIAQQVRTQSIKNITTEIINKGKRIVNNKSVGYIEYYFKKNTTNRFGEIILAINNREAYIINIYSLNQEPEDFSVQCHAIIESIVFLNKKDLKD